MLFPSTAVATRCLDFLSKQTAHRNSPDQPFLKSPNNGLRILELVLRNGSSSLNASASSKTIISAVIFPETDARHAKTFWQHSGDGVSSRRAEFCFRAFEEGYLIPRNSSRPVDVATDRMCKGPRRYQTKASVGKRVRCVLTYGDGNSSPAAPRNSDAQDYAQFVEERFGRNLDLSLAANAKVAIRRRIAGFLTANVDLPDALNTSGASESVRKVQDFSEDDIYLYPCGMSSIFNTHRIMLKTKGELKSISFGYGLCQ